MILDVSNLVVSFDTENGRLNSVDGVSFSLRQGYTLGIVGESGCGKSVTALAIMGLLPRPSGRIESGTIKFNGENIVPLRNSTNNGRQESGIGSSEIGKIRGRHISMIFQEPMTALNPVHRIGAQINEVYNLHFPDMNRHQVNEASIQMLEQVGIANPEKVVARYPHQLSGGMRQRVMIAMALASKPDILVADEPTTALDVTVQAQILDMISALKKKMSMSVMLITHDLGVVAENCDDAVVMYAGKIVEKAGVATLFSNPLHPYTRGLLKSIPGLAVTPKSILSTIKGRVPSLEDMPPGCRFSNRCKYVMDICKDFAPDETQTAKEHFVACHMFGMV